MRLKAALLFVLAIASEFNSKGGTPKFGILPHPISMEHIYVFSNEVFLRNNLSFSVAISASIFKIQRDKFAKFSSTSTSDL